MVFTKYILHYCFNDTHIGYVNKLPLKSEKGLYLYFLKPDNLANDIRVVMCIVRKLLMWHPTTVPRAPNSPLAGRQWVMQWRHQPYSVASANM